MKRRMVIILIFAIMMSFSTNRKVGIFRIGVNHPVSAAITSHIPIFLDGNAVLDGLCSGNGTDSLS